MLCVSRCVSSTIQSFRPRIFAIGQPYHTSDYHVDNSKNLLATMTPLRLSDPIGKSHLTSTLSCQHRRIVPRLSHGLKPSLVAVQTRRRNASAVGLTRSPWLNLT